MTSLKSRSLRGGTSLTERKSGPYISVGEPYFHAWEYRIQLRPAGATDENISRIARNTTENGLRGFALHSAGSIGLDRLSTKKGFDNLIDAIHGNVFTLQNLGAKELFAPRPTRRRPDEQARRRTHDVVRRQATQVMDAR